MDFSEIQELINLFENTSLHEIEVEQDGRRIRLSRGGVAYSAPAQYVLPANAIAPAAPTPQSGAPEVVNSASPLTEGQVTIDSPMVGTFYSATAPGEPPFILPGDTVQKDKTICIVEAMKIMNEVAAKFPCIIERILVENGEPVEYGQPLFAVRPLA